MADRQSSNDDVTGKQLRLLIGLVVVLASGAIAWSVAALPRHPAQTPTTLSLIALVLAIALANRTAVVIRIRSQQRGVSWTEVGVLVGLTMVPAPWVVLCTAAGITVSRLSTRTPFQRSIFGIAKETLVAATAAAIFVSTGAVPDASGPDFPLGTITIAAVAMWVLDELLFAPVMALATRTGYAHMLRDKWVLRVIALIARYVVSVLVIGIVAFDPDTRLLVAVPLVVLCIHLWQAGHIRRGEELDSWRRLAQTTDELNVVALDSVLRSAVVRVAQLFSADDAEILLRRHDGDRLVRATSGAITYDGDPGDAPESVGTVMPTALTGRDGKNPVGELRLRFRNPVKLTDSEGYKLKTFASALYTAIRNASAYAELERIARENEHAALHDPLTGLANRRALLERSSEILAARQTDGMTALLLIDLNHFKEVNDTLGHSAGDQVLCAVAARLQSACRPGDLVARLGGDEFALLMTGLPTPAMAAHRSDALLAALDRPIEVDGMSLTVEACGGIALAPGTGGVTELLRRADVAMYQAKRAGQRTATYVHARDTTDVNRLMLGGELSRAVTEHEFIVDFQPIVDLGTGEVTAAEALARWHHPQHGNLTPMRFLQTVERSGQLPAFADAVLEQSLTAYGTWRDAGFDVPVTVNVSPRSLLDPQFPTAVLNRLTAHGVPADRLVLELTETLTISQLDVVDRALAEFRDAGVRLALDDFGTGFSSLPVLSRIPVHELKIDHEFVTAVETSPRAAAVIRSTVDLARSLQLNVVAVGVESEPQRLALWELGCGTGQGHLFARPMPSARLLGALRRGTAGRPATLAAPLHDAGAVVRLPRKGRSGGRGRSSLPHLPA